LAKSKKTVKEKVPAPPPLSESLPLRGKAVAAAGSLAALLGLAVLSRADAAGGNWAATASPLLILAGYAAIGIGLILPPPPPSSSAGL
jgi:uncharacterized membrane protein